MLPKSLNHRVTRIHAVIYISFSSYKQQIGISNFDTEILFTYFLSKYFHDKSFK